MAQETYNGWTNYATWRVNLALEATAEGMEGNGNAS